MPLIRVAALVVLGLAVFLAVLWVIPREVAHADRVLSLVFLLVAAVNALFVSRLARIRRARAGEVALWLVLIGAVAGIAIGTGGDWLPFVLRYDGSFIGLPGFLAMASWIAAALFWPGLAALTAGWGLWLATRRGERLRPA